MTDHRTRSADDKDADQLGRNTAPFRESRIARRERERRSRRRRRLFWWSTVTATVAGSVIAAAVTGAFSSAVHIVERTPSPTAQKGHAKPKVEGSGTPGRGKGSTPGVTPYGRAHVRAGPALRMVSAYPMDGWAVRAWVFPRGFVPSPALIAQIDKERHQPQLVNRALFGAGGDPPSVDVQFIFHNNRPYPVSVSDIQVQKSCQAPYSGTIFDGLPNIPSAGFGPSGTQLGINLDSSNPEVMLAPGWNVKKWKHEYASGAPVSIPAGDSHEFDLRAITLHRACSFRLVLTVVDGGSARSLTFGDYGIPFRVSALLPGVLGREKRNHHPYHGYRRMYAGAAASPWPDGTWVRENPQTTR